jgi:hypothetical protein
MSGRSVAERDAFEEWKDIVDVGVGGGVGVDVDSDGDV